MRPSHRTLPKLTPVERETVQEKVYQELREALMRGRFVPGSPVTLRALAEAFGTSPMPVREALRRLVAELGLVVSPNRTVMVPLITAERFDELRRIRVALEGMLAEQAAATVTGPELRSLARLYDEIDAAVAADDIPRYLEKNQEFHFAIYRAARLPNALRIVENLWLQVGPLLNFLLTESDDQADGFFNRKGSAVFQKHHRQALEALEKRDGDGARRGIVSDINEAAQFLLASRHFAGSDASGATPDKR